MHSAEKLLPEDQPSSRRLQIEWNATQAEFPGDHCLHELFEDHVCRTPDSLAVVFSNPGDESYTDSSVSKQITYSALNVQANRLAHHLRMLGVGPQVRVGLCLQRSLELVVGLLAILKAGGAYVPLDPTYPPERLAFMLTDAQVTLLLTQTTLRDQFAAVIQGNVAHVVEIDQPEIDWSVTSTVNLSTGVQPDNLAYLIYTSGSTGAPKGVMVAHPGLSNLAQAQTRIYGIRPSDHVLQFASISFDAAISEVIMALCHGATLYLSTSEALLPGPGLIRLFEEQAITCVTLPPSVLAVLPLADLPDLRLIIVAGEACAPYLLAHWGRKRLFFNAYGPTEASVWSTVETCSDPSRPLPIGRPIINTQAYVLDVQLQPTPVGIPGELYLGGVGLAQGYFGRPDLTAERFIPSPFSGMEEGMRLYKTGDLACYRPDGKLEFLGRRDQQVKIRGFRIELGEIEAILVQHPLVRETVVLAREDVPNEKRLVAYVAASQDTELSGRDLSSFLKKQLPEYMLPSAFVFLDALPLTPNGKLDRRTLPRPELQETYVAPRSPNEELLAGIWSEIFRRKRIGIYDNFFEMGGHSLLATQLLARVRQIFGIELPLRSFFEAPTVAGLSGIIEKHSNREQHFPLQPIMRDGSLHLPLTFPQEQVWFLQQLEPTNRSYHAQATLRLTGTLDVAVLERSLNEIVRRHEIFRTTFEAVDGHPTQVIHASMSVSLAIIDLYALPEEERAAETECILQGELQKPFSLTQLPLARWTLVRLDAQTHLLIHVEHHLVHDGWSFNVFIRELVELYKAFSAGEPSPLPELPIQFADFAYWQRQWMQEDVLEAQLSYWKKHLADSPRFLELPTDRPRPAIQTFRGAALRVNLSQVLYEELKALGRREGVTLFMSMLAALLMLLHRYSGQEKICIGSGVANRRWRETEDLIGMIVNTIVLSTDLSGNPTFSELLRRVREVTLEAYTYQDLPFDKLVEALQPERNLSYNPLFQVIFGFHDSPLPHLELPDLTLQLTEGLNNGSAKFDMNIVVVPRAEQRVGFSHEASEEGITLIWEYNTDLFEEATITRMTRCYQTLLEGVVLHSHKRISDLSLLTETEKQQLLVGWNTTRAPYPQDRCLHQLIEAQATERPDTIAVVMENCALTYQALNERANQLALYLQGLGVEPDQLVGICISRSVEMVISLLGVLKAGAAYVPLDPSYPRERLAFLLNDMHARVLLTQQRFCEQLSEFANLVVCLDRDWSAIAQASAAKSHHEVSPDHLAYVIYTSGSTGQPKGVEVPHRGACNLVAALKQTLAIGPGDRLLQFASLSFDASVLEIFVALVHGASLILANKEELLPGPPLLEMLQREAITATLLPPSALTVMPSSPLPHLRILLSGGEACSAGLVATWAPGRSFYNAYGPTEASVCTTVARCHDGSVQPPIGRPLANMQVYVLDAALQPVPIGVAGELYIAGVGLARGYLRRPELTAERFVPHPYSLKPGSRLYRTGDLARWQADGALEFVGRIDEQVKLRGYRIEPGEIEAVLRNHPTVQEAVVLLRELPTGAPGLVAYIVSEQKETEHLRSWLGEFLPDYMVPTIFMPLERLPLTPSGKVNRGALPVPQMTQEGPDTSAVTPHPPLEEILVGIWCEVLGLQRIGIHKNFFALGGHSLLATQVMARLRTVLGVEIPLRTIFEAPTVAELAQKCLLYQQTHQGLLPPPIVALSRPQTFPLSFAQQRLWFLDQFEPDNPFYNTSAAMHLRGRLHREALKQSLDEIVRRHEVLRTTFAVSHGHPVQVINPVLPSSLALVDLMHLDFAAQTVERQRLARAEAQRPFDLTQGPLIRTTLIQLAKDEHILLLTMHHITSDGWSTGIFISELARLYAAFTQGLPSPLPDLPIQYADFASWQRQWLQGEVLQQQLGYWKTQLAGAPAFLDLPTDHPRPAIQRYRGAIQRFLVPQEVHKGLKQLSQREGVTLFMTLLAAFQLLLLRYSGQEDIVVGTPIANRTQADLESLIGFFVNMLALRTDLSGNPSFRELLRRVREVALAAYAHQDVPFEQLVEALQPPRELSRSPLFQVTFALQNTPMPSLELKELILQQVQGESVISKYDLTLFIREQEGELEGVWEYNTDLFEDGTIRRIERHFQRLLVGIVAEPEQRLANLPLLNAQEWQQIVIDWNASQTVYPRETCLHQLIEAQVEVYPDVIAVTDEAEQLTCTVLNKRANQLAHHLQKLGVRTEVRIGLYLRRSTEMLVGLLGILKAGAAYVPFDIASPYERLSYIATDAQVSIILTQQQLAQQWAERRVNIIRLDTDWWTIRQESEQNPESLVAPENLAYVIYTSGSTGKPKGTMISHHSLINHLIWCTKAFAVQEGCGAPVHSSPGFDLTIPSLFSPLLVGRSVVMLTESAGVESLEQALCLRRDFSYVKLTPSHLRLLNRVLSPEGLSQAASTFVIAGEALLAEDLAFWRTHAPAIKLINEYGPTEAAVGSCTYEVPVDACLSGAVPIGRPTANTTLYVLDKQLMPVPIGIPGELYIAGDGLARGYLNRPELTAERFVPNPFSTIPGMRLYRTGDMVRYRPDGNLVFLGRLDHQVKIRGYRVELGEIETILTSHPAVRESIVLVREDQPGDQRLVAYVVADDHYLAQEYEVSQTGKIVSQLRSLLSEQLPDYMVPAAFILLDELPLTPNGKVNRQALPLPEQTRPESGVAFVAPRNPIEQVLTSIWAEVLNIESIGIYDNFFALGGHSLLATQVASRIVDALQVELSLRAFFEAPTIAGLAMLLLLDPERRVKVEKTAELFMRLLQLSDEEVDLLLDKRAMY